VPEDHGEIVGSFLDAAAQAAATATAQLAG
jgi:hypothetical protein